MKKLVFAFAAFIAVSFASCGGNQKANNETVSTDSIEAVTMDVEMTPSCCDSASCDSVKTDSACCNKAE